MSLNVHVLVGHLGQDIELKETKGGKTLAVMSLATDDGYYDKAKDQWIESVHWHRVVIYREELAKRLAEKVGKGDLVYVQGRLETGRYEKDGVKHFTATTVAETAKPLESGRAQ